MDLAEQDEAILDAEEEDDAGEETLEHRRPSSDLRSRPSLPAPTATLSLICSLRQANVGMLSSFGDVEPHIYSRMAQDELNRDSPLIGLECVMMDYIFGKKKATQVVHSVWEHVVQKGDAVVDATCGNGYDTLVMVNMVADKSRAGRVYAMDIQETAIKNTMSLLDRSLHSNEKEMVELYATCHSEMEQVVPRTATVRVVAFNLGYLPGGDKTVITKPETTLLGMEAATRIVVAGGVISMLVYVGHPGGMEEYEMVEAFASGLPVDTWICCKLQMLNRPLAPILLLLCKR
ncbi:unnamed protein product [Lactuca virosa]|uniref:rRNA methylase YtqB n=1 Tax=Lactuca virosa TaxID=75947 RepID=A0AAU9PJY7_9ASTR|nr:unnamed protein product [Lactuca virosa]